MFRRARAALTPVAGRRAGAGRRSCRHGSGPPPAPRQALCRPPRAARAGRWPRARFGPMPAIDVDQLVVRYGDVIGVNGISLDGRGGRGAGPARPQWCREDHDGRDARGLPPAGVGHRPGPGPRSAAGASPAPPAHRRHAPARAGCTPGCRPGRRVQPLRPLLRRSRGAGGTAVPRRAHVGGGDALAAAVGRRAAAPLPGPGPGRSARGSPSWTSPRPASTPRAAWPSGRSSGICGPLGCASCSPPTRWRRPSGSPTGS